MNVKDDVNRSNDKEKQKNVYAQKENAHILQELHIYLLHSYTSGTDIRKGLRTVMYGFEIEVSIIWLLDFPD